MYWTLSHARQSNRKADTYSYTLERGVVFDGGGTIMSIVLTVVSAFFIHS